MPEETNVGFDKIFTFAPSVKTTIGSSQTKLNVSFDNKENETIRMLKMAHRNIFFYIRFYISRFK